MAVVLSDGILIHLQGSFSPEHLTRPRSITRSTLQGVGGSGTEAVMVNEVTLRSPVACRKYLRTCRLTMDRINKRVEIL
jgi:hypothetical protein